jgi:hypothetical protein
MANPDEIAMALMQGGGGGGPPPGPEGGAPMPEQGGGESPEAQLQMLAEALAPILVPMMMQAMSGGGEQAAPAPQAPPLA